MQSRPLSNNQWRRGQLKKMSYTTIFVLINHAELTKLRMLNTRFPLIIKC